MTLIFHCLKRQILLQPIALLRKTMNSDSFPMLFSFAVLAAVFVCFVKEWIAAELVALAGMSALIIGGVLREDDLKVVFGNTAPLTIGAMFVLSEALTRTGAIDWLARTFERWAGTAQRRVLVVLALIVMPLSAFLNNTPVVVIFLPVLLAFCRSSGLKASKLLIPLSFLSILGGTMTLIGTSTNLLVAGVAKDVGQPAFGIFEITRLGVVYAVIGFTYLYFFGNRLLPNRETLSSLLDAEDTRRFLSAGVIDADSPLAGVRLIEHPMFSNRKRAIVYEVARHGRRIDDIPLDALVMKEGDVLWFRATANQLAEIRETKGISLVHDKIGEELAENGNRTEARLEVTTVEAIIGSRSSMIGRSVRGSNLRRRYGVVVAAVHRQGENLQEGYQDIRLAFGDTLLIEGPSHNLAQLQKDEDFLSLNEKNLQTPRKSKVFVAAGILAAVVLCSAFEVMSITSAALVGAVLVILTRCVDLRDAYHSVEWSILFLIYGMLAVGRALEITGGAELLAVQVVRAMQDFGPVVILSAIYLLASILTEFVTNNAVAILLTPVVISIAANLGVDPRPFIVAIMFGASASFITPIGYQTNTYVYGAGGYKFSDFLRIGIPLNLLLWMTATWLIPKFWPF